MVPLTVVEVLVRPLLIDPHRVALVVADGVATVAEFALTPQVPLVAVA
jgi:hypothetical protein